MATISGNKITYTAAEFTGLTQPGPSLDRLELDLRQAAGVTVAHTGISRDGGSGDVWIDFKASPAAIQAAITAVIQAHTGEPLVRRPDPSLPAAEKEELVGGMTFSAPVNVSTTQDSAAVSQPIELRGVEVSVSGAQFGDWVTCRVLDGVTSAMLYTPVLQAPLVDGKLAVNWPEVWRSKVGVKMRVIYNATAVGLARDVTARYHLRR